MKRAVLTLLASLGVAAGLAVTASSTSATAYDAGMRGLALGAVVVVLEVVNTLGTWVWLTDSRRHAQWQAGGLVGCASVVTGWCGVLTYGPIGLVGPVFVLAGVHLANLAATTPAHPVAHDAQAPRLVPTVPVYRHAGTPPTPTTPAQPDEVGEVGEPPTPSTAAQADAQAPSPPTEEAPTQPSPPTTPSPDARLNDEEIVAHLIGRAETPGRDAICREFRCGKTKAERVLATLADRRRPHLVTTREETAR